VIKLLERIDCEAVNRRSWKFLMKIRVYSFRFWHVCIESKLFLCFFELQLLLLLLDRFLLVCRSNRKRIVLQQPSRCFEQFWWSKIIFLL
jgi:hypothetical protein